MRSLRCRLAAIAAALAGALLLASIDVGSASAGSAAESDASSPESLLDLGPSTMLGGGLGDMIVGPRARIDRKPQPALGIGRAAIDGAGAGTNRGHGFLRDARGFTTIDAPGCRGHVCHRQQRPQKGGGAATAMPAGGSTASCATGAASSGSTSRARPGRVAWKANARGQIVGTYTFERDRAAQFFEYGFVLDRRGFGKIGNPGRVRDAALRDQRSWSDRGRVRRSRRPGPTDSSATRER